MTKRSKRSAHAGTQAKTGGSRPQRGQISTVSRQELQDVLMDPGYSAGQRKAWLKNVLTRLQRQNNTAANPETSEMISEVKDAIRSLQPEKPLSDKVM